MMPPPSLSLSVPSTQSSLHRTTDHEDSDTDLDHDDVRCEEFLRVKIGEAKNLIPRSGSGLRDVYCTVNLDREEIFRTSVSEKTLSPFFAEEFHFEIPRTFHRLSFYLYDRDTSIRPSDKVIGKVSIWRSDLTTYNGKDHWIPIRSVHEDSEVQGKIHVAIKVDNVINSKTGLTVEKLNVRVMECNELSIINGTCNPFVQVTLYHGTEGRMETKRTKSKKKTDSPMFDETFHFNMSGRTRSFGSSGDITSSIASHIKFTVFHESGAVGFGNTFLGEVIINLEDVIRNRGYNCWHMLSSREGMKDFSSTSQDLIESNGYANGCNTITSTISSGNKGSGKSLGSLRLKMQYTSDNVLPSRFYDPLRNLILKSPDSKFVSSSASFILGELVTNKIDAAQPLMRLFVDTNRVRPLVKSLAEWEIAKVTDPNTIFRGNTLLSKFLDELMKMIGTHYLHETLRSVITRVIHEKKCCEIDVMRLKDPHDQMENMSNLCSYLDHAFTSIYTSVIMCPRLMREVFFVMRELSLQYFPDQREISYSVISGFIFLRFFAPAILNPRLFEITDQNIDPMTVGRTLTLMSKAVQMMGNLVSSCTKPAEQENMIFKEDYMSTLQKFYITQQNIENTRIFLEVISSSNVVTIPRICDLPMLLKEGTLLKRVAGNTNRFGMTFRKFKRRFFRLTTHGLLYSRSRSKAPAWILPICDIMGVEKLRDDSFKMKHMFQILFKDRALYMKAGNCVEQKEWIDLLSKICLCNKHRMRDYHPAAFIGNQWMCCHETNVDSPGCCPMSRNVPPDIAIHIDPDREVARIQSLLSDQMTTIDDVLDICETSGCGSINTNSMNKNSKAGTVMIEDPISFGITLNNVRTMVKQLERDQKYFQRKRCDDLIYGSQEAPIGDHNYLMMMAKHNQNNEHHQRFNGSGDKLL